MFGLVLCVFYVVPPWFTAFIVIEPVRFHETRDPNLTRDF